jgi:hypothetical protein
LTGISLCDVCSCHEILRAQRTWVGIPHPPAPWGLGGGEGATLSAFTHTAEQKLDAEDERDGQARGPLNLMAVEGQLCEGNKYHLRAMVIMIKALWIG